MGSPGRVLRPEVPVAWDGDGCARLFVVGVCVFLGCC